MIRYNVLNNFSNKIDILYVLTTGGGGADYLTPWNPKSYVAYRVPSVLKICKVRALLKNICTFKTV